MLIRWVASRPAPRAGNVRTHQSSQHAGGEELSRVMLPPTPPLRPDTHFDDGQSPSSSSQRSSSSAPSHYPSTFFTPLEMHPQVPSQMSSMSSRPMMPPASFSYTSSSGQLSSGPCASVNDGPSGTSDWYQQRPLPQVYHPSMMPNVMPGASGTNPWQHHHSIPLSSQAAFPPSQDRYICQTCSKAFSRPSSLRIHSHSHTGEKPFKCPHQGCGKAFSVRSNMKRHERGCHAASPSPM